MTTMTTDLAQGNITVRMIEGGQLDRQLERIALAVRRRWKSLRVEAEIKAGVKVNDGDTLARGVGVRGPHIPARARRHLPPQLNRVLKPGDLVVVNDRGPWRLARLRCEVVRATAKSARVKPYRGEKQTKAEYDYDMRQRGIKLYTQIHGKTVPLAVLDAEFDDGIAVEE